MRKDNQQLWQLAEPTVQGGGYELVELQWHREQDGWVLRVFIDRADATTTGAAIAFDDCERVSRDLSAALDVSDAIPHAYRLEVSSPGIDRPMRRLRDFRRFVGAKVKIRTTDAVEGRRNFSGTIRDARGSECDGVVEVECDGSPYQVPVNAIARAHLVPDWDAEFRKAHKNDDRSMSA